MHVGQLNTTMLYSPERLILRLEDERYQNSRFGLRSSRGEGRTGFGTVEWIIRATLSALT